MAPVDAEVGDDCAPDTHIHWKPELRPAAGKEGSTGSLGGFEAGDLEDPNINVPGDERGGTERRKHFVYAIGRVEATFSSLAIEREFAQAVGRIDSTGLTDRETLQSILTDRGNRHLAREMCYTFTIEGLPTYILAPHDPADIELLVQALDRPLGEADRDAVIGTRGPLAPPDACNGLVVPILVFDQLFSFDRREFVEAIPLPREMDDEETAQFRESAQEVFDRIVQMADNAGATDEHRALNYLAMRYPALYANVAEAHRQQRSLTRVEAYGSRLSGPRDIIDVVFSYTHRINDVVDKFMVRVDVTEKFPFLVTKLQPFYDRS
jgi:hypothetical protein